MARGFVVAKMWLSLRKHRGIDMSVDKNSIGHSTFRDRWVLLPVASLIAVIGFREESSGRLLSRGRPPVVGRWYFRARKAGIEVVKARCAERTLPDKETIDDSQLLCEQIYGIVFASK